MAIYLCVSACSSSKWSWQEMQGIDPSFCSHKLIYYPTYPQPAWNLEFFYFQNQLSAFIHLFTEKLPSQLDRLLPISLEIGSSIYEGTAFIFEGRQKLGLSPSLVEKLISALKERVEIKIIFENYELPLLAENFPPFFETIGYLEENKNLLAEERSNLPSY